MPEGWETIRRRPQMPFQSARFPATGTPKRGGADRPQPKRTGNVDARSTSPLQNGNGAVWREGAGSFQNPLALGVGSLSSPTQHLSQLGESPRHVSPEDHPQYAATALLQRLVVAPRLRPDECPERVFCLRHRKIIFWFVNQLQEQPRVDPALVQLACGVQEPRAVSGCGG